MRLAPALALACLVLPAVAEAAAVSYSAPALGAASPVPNTIAAFDLSLGTLERVQLRLTGVVSDSFSGGSRYNVGSTLEVVPTFLLDPLGFYQTGEPITVPVYSYQGYPLYSGGYSEPIDSVVEIPHQIYQYAFDIGPDGGATYGLAVNTSLSDGWLMESFEFRPEFRGTATATYTYSPAGVPEPTSLALLAFGLAGCLVVARRAAGVAPLRRRLVPALALAGLMAPVAAQATAVSYSAPASGSDSGVLNTIADFDPALGLLERVQLRLTGTVSASFSGAVRGRYDSWDYEPGVKPSSRITFVTATGTPYVFLHPYGGYEWLGSPVTFDFMIMSGYFSGGYSTAFDATTDLPAEIFGKSLDLPPEFFGSHPDGGKTYALGAGSTSVGASFSTWTWEARSEFRGTATMTYFYRPLGVAEPDSLAVLGLGLTGCLAARASRRRRVRSAPR